MKIYLVQHGEAKSKAEDHDRSLTDLGIRNTRKVAAWLGKQAADIITIHHSGKKRAEQTAEIFAGLLMPAKGSAAVSGLNPNDDVHAYAVGLGEQDGDIMIVGHLPFLARMAGLLVAGEPEKGVVSFTNSGVVCLQEEQGRWSVIWSVVPDLLEES